MQQFTVPQFIDVEDKIIGPVTTRQFIIMLATALLIFIFYKLLAFTPFLILAVILFGVGGTIAFARINGQPFHFFLLNFLQTFRSPKLQLWDKTPTEAFLQAAIRVTPALPAKVSPRKEVLTSSRLAEISLIVDTGGAYTGES
ncbi:hypothetical protein A3B21_04605 [Candidatus Uhrbacteria bacterium RIFCSPLOWO2_01_FULL_47_24]|uniref:PrgI family protein n=1 Tax=Candidatus Uhrbacteria bacterium RIFCSPLOWO2_01_FULL_47_24 TaxID=1802401 RepID=A0A1F7UTS9_9BACT|nr:MAG: hypothetical protein A3F52_01410 [Candidatus Uhrbacteria bacterium RIFCSPHIGHO2_12_FULL_47_11]OGL81701.1 MAG: hypothetical protein A3B21_04605 [Candidatus Uhrbacteria bacterium RIFCSPLOWO2_01_FULL_47_24]OGL85046.1 MAG: hypothetical protein A3J03_03715 [Candidatus Uhrbacteria bacterium RIFCSPLOWO2_02_FULL_46_25]OGL93146.1 MAG: hypothetical protein A3H11_00225 [Candidatus Uhrbacteria bacterium RIFCSPLOWO2_12_FULL_47_10]